MSPSINHLPGVHSEYIATPRLRMHVLSSGPADGEPVLLLHGNLASSTFWEETMLALPSGFRAVAPDMRGFGLTDPAERVDATRGFADWADDAMALADALGWEQFHVVGHSLGGCIIWALIGQHALRLASATLVASGPPCGFGGARGERGELNYADGAGSGAGLAQPQLIERLRAGDLGDLGELFSPRGVAHRLFWKPPFCPPREHDLVTAMLQTHLGEDRYPGDWRPSSNWPGFAPGVHGPINAMSPLYNQWVLPKLLEAGEKPRLLWVHGSDDIIISDASPPDPGVQGQLGLRGGWPGDEVFPAQPFLTEVTYAVDEYARRGGAVTRLLMNGVAHSPFLERPDEFQQALARHLTKDE